MRKKKSDSSKCSAESEDSGLGLKDVMVWDRYNKKLRKIMGTLSAGNAMPHGTTGFDLIVSGQTTTTNTPAKSTGQDSGQESLLKVTSEKSQLQIYQTMTSSQLASLVRVFPLPENVEVFRTSQGELFSSRSAESYEIKDQATYSLRMLRDYFLTTEAGHSLSYSFRWMNLGMMRNGLSQTLNITYRRIARGSLSSVLEERANEKYYLPDQTLRKLIEHKQRHEEKGHGFGMVIRSSSDTAATVTAFGENKENLIREEKHGQDKQGKEKRADVKNKGERHEDRGRIPEEPVEDRLERIQETPREIQDRHCVPGEKAGDIPGRLLLARMPETLQEAEEQLQLLAPEDRGEQEARQENDESIEEKRLESPENMGARFKIRRLTPKECERLQGFPDGWTKGVSDTQRYKMMGNAVSVPVIAAIGRKILEAIR